MDEPGRTVRIDVPDAVDDGEDVHAEVCIHPEHHQEDGGDQEAGELPPLPTQGEGGGQRRSRPQPSRQVQGGREDSRDDDQVGPVPHYQEEGEEEEEEEGRNIRSSL